MKTPITVIIVCDYGFIKGGAEKVAIESAIGLAQKGINVIYFCAVGPIDQRILDNDINVVCLEQTDINTGSKIVASIQGVWNMKAYFEFDKILKKYKSSEIIIHAHLWQKALSSSIFLSALKNRVKIVFTMHHYFLACPNGGFFNYKKNEICTKRGMSCNCILTNCDKKNYFNKLYRVFRMYLEQRFAKLPSLIKNYIIISDLGKEIMEGYLPKDSNYYMINNPFNFEDLARVQVEKNQSYIFIGRLSPEKGVIELAKISKELGINLLMVGDGPEKEKILQINPDVKITGWVAEEQVKKYIKLSRALIFPTLWYEGMPMTIIECLSLGVPCIIPDTCAATQVVKDGENGFVYKQGDLEDLKQKVYYTMNNDNLNRLSKNAFSNFIQEDYSLENHCRSLIATYQKLI